MDPIKTEGRPFSWEHADGPSGHAGDLYDRAVLYVPAEAVEKCQETVPWKYFKKIEAYNFNSGIEDVVVDADSEAPCEIYNLHGVKVGSDLEGLPTGLYILRQGKVVKKIAVE